MKVLGDFAPSLSCRGNLARGDIAKSQKAGSASDILPAVSDCDLESGNVQQGKKNVWIFGSPATQGIIDAIFRTLVPQIARILQL